jgi:hypothetical protein
MRANKELQEGYLGSSQWYWLTHLKEYGGYTPLYPLCVMRWGWDNHTKKECPKTTQQPFEGAILPIDHRIIGSKEIIFDLDLKPPWTCWGKIYTFNKILCDTLDTLEIPYYITHSGGKGCHIHIFTQEYKASKAQWILAKAGLTKYYGVNKPIDPNGLNGRHMIRCIGGRKHHSPHTVTYKSVIDKLRIQHKPITLKKDITYPDKIKVWK